VKARAQKRNEFRREKKREKKGVRERKRKIEVGEATQKGGKGTGDTER